MAAGLGLSIFCESYRRSDPHPPYLPGSLAAWFSTWASSAWLVIAAVLLPLLFPDGRLPTRRARWVLRLAFSDCSPACCRRPFGSGPLGVEVEAPILSPFGIGKDADGALAVIAGFGTAVGGIGWFTGLGCLVFGIPAVMPSPSSGTGCGT